MIVLKHPVETNETQIVLGKEVSIVDTGWGIDFDELNIILYKLGISTNKDSKSFGKITQTAEGYYPNLSACIRGMMSKQLMIDGISLGDVASIKDLEMKMDAFCKGVWGAVNSRISE